MTIEIIEYLKNASLKTCFLDHNIRSSAKTGDRFFSLNYDQIASVPGPLVNQCRGIILATHKPLTESQIYGDQPIPNLMILARPFDRFFNYGDAAASPVDFSSSVFFEKLDGTMVLLYYNSVLGEWAVATRSVPLANNTISGWDDTTFRHLFEKALKFTVAKFKNFEEWSNSLDKTKTYVCELTTPANRIIVEYDNYSVHLLGIRDTQTGEETPIHNISEFHGIPTCPVHKLEFVEILNFVNSKSPQEQEGIVVCDNNFNRCKIKNLAYVMHNKIKDETAISPSSVMELILSGNLDDCVGILNPHIQEKANLMNSNFVHLVKSLNKQFLECFEETKHSSNQRKDFALEVQNRGLWMPPLMDMFCGRCVEVGEFLQNKKDPKTGKWPQTFVNKLVELCLKT